MYSGQWSAYCGLRIRAQVICETLLKFVQYCQLHSVSSASEPYLSLRVEVRPFEESEIEEEEPVTLVEAKVSQGGLQGFILNHVSLVLCKAQNLDWLVRKCCGVLTELAKPQDPATEFLVFWVKIMSLCGLTRRHVMFAF